MEGIINLFETKTVEGYKIESFSEYNLNISIYKKLPFDGENNEPGLCGRVRNSNADDRFDVMEFCIWNSEGKCVYVSSGCYGGDWGEIEYYQLIKK